ncbi:MAG: CoA protein activase [Firmicutes bacterium]|nr:CoA protein activase [Bacillota bacterium]MCL5057871.1 CoA protein activase [Actinomycetota bacterium]
MKVTFPHMGNLWICLDAMLQYLGIETVVPPPSSKKTLNLGSKHSPEFACMPLKLNLGNFMEASERGADTIVMAGGCGPCRFGYYAQVEHIILEDLGYKYSLVVMEPPEKHISELLSRIRYITGNKPWMEVIRGIKFGYRKARAVDRLEMAAMRKRPLEKRAGQTDTALTEALSIIAGSAYGKLDDAIARASEIMDQIPVDRKPVLKIGLVGEIYTLLEPFANLDIERKLGRLGVEVDRSIYLSEWVNDHLFMGLIKGLRSSSLYIKSSAPYMRHFVGGHGQETLGAAVYYNKKGYDGIIQVLPFTCMPEIVAQSILPGFSRDTGMPVMTLIVDEQTGESGYLTRLEAFVDLLAEKGARKEELA